MTTKTEALKLALEAIELHLMYHENGCTYLGPVVPVIQEALAQPEQEPLAYLPGVLTNFCSRCGKRLMSALGPVSIHTCTPPQPTGWDNGLSQDYNKKLGAWFSEKPNAKEELRARTFDDYGNKIV